MGLRSRGRQTVDVTGLGLHVEFADGEEIETEVSAKFRRAGITCRARSGRIRADGLVDRCVRRFRRGPGSALDDRGRVAETRPAPATGAPGPPQPDIEHYRAVRAATEALAAPLSPEDQTVQSMPDVSPTKWHRAHVTWFFEQFVLMPHQPGYRPIDDRYRYLWNSYYEGVGPRHPRAERGLLSRPGVGEVTAYRDTVDEAVEDLLGRSLPPNVLDLIELGLHHEQQHQELLLMDIKHVLGTNPLHPAYRLTRPPRAPIPAGLAGSTTRAD